MVSNESLVVSGVLSATLASALVGYYSYLVIQEKKKYQKIPGPEQKGLTGFLYGNTLVLRKEIIEDGNTMAEYLVDMIPEYGETYKLRLMHRTLLITCDAYIIKKVLIDDDSPKSPETYNVVGYPSGERFLGHGLVTDTNYERWKHRRSLFNPGFHRQALISFLNEFNSKSNILTEFLMKKADGKTPVKLLKVFNATTLDVIASVAFSMNIDSINDPNNMFNVYITKSLGGLADFFFDPFIKFKPHKWPLIWKYRKVVRYLRKVGREQIVARINAIKNGEYLPNDILTTILNSHKDEEFEIEAMVDDFVTFFIAGQETTATTLTFLFMELAKNPDVFTKLREEVDRVIGSKSELTYDDISELKYTNCAFKEALRLYPPATGVSRKTTKEIVTKDFVIPKDSFITLSIFGCGRSEKYFPDTFKFKPERFSKDEDDPNGSIATYTFFPFSLGPRNCIGQNFAQFEAKVIIAKLVQNFDLELCPDQSFKIIQEGTIRPKDGVMVYLRPRK